MTLDLKIRLSRQLTWSSYLLLFVLLIVTTPLDANAKAIVLMLSVKLVPLLIVLPGMLKNRLKSYIWLCFVVLLYFTESSVQAWLTQGDLLPVTMASASVVIFLSAMYYVRWQRQKGQVL